MWPRLRLFACTTAEQHDRACCVVGFRPVLESAPGKLSSSSRRRRVFELTDCVGTDEQSPPDWARSSLC